MQIRAGANFETCYAHIMRGFATVALVVAVLGSAVSAQTLRDRVREFGREHPNAVYRFPRAPVDFAGPQTIEEPVPLQQYGEPELQTLLAMGL